MLPTACLGAVLTGRLLLAGLLCAALAEALLLVFTRFPSINFSPAMYLNEQIRFNFVGQCTVPVSLRTQTMLSGVVAPCWGDI